MKRILLFFVLTCFASIGFSQSDNLIQKEQVRLNPDYHQNNSIRTGGCFGVLDTITTYIDRATAFYNLTAGSSGYVFGTGSVTSQTAVHYDAQAGRTTVCEIMFYATHIEIISGADSLEFIVYACAADTTPDSIVGSAKILVSDIDTSGNPTYLAVPNAKPFSGHFMISALHGAINDTVAFYSSNVTTNNGGPDGNGEKRVRQFRTSTASWVAAYDIWSFGPSTPLDADAIIMPVVCVDTNTGPCIPPVSGWTSSPNNLIVTFTNNTSNNPTSCTWDFGDGNTSTMMAPTHTYASAGTYTVCLVCQNACGADTSCNPVTVSCAPPTASYTYATNNLTANFSDGSSGSGLTYAWDFGDGNTSTMQNPSHTYANDTTVDVCLVITNNCGASDTTCQTVTVMGVGIENSLFSQVSVFPNPGSGMITVSLRLMSGTDVEFKVLDLSGRKVFGSSENLKAGQLNKQLDLNGLEGGMYMLEISSAQGKLVRKILLK